MRLLAGFAQQEEAAAAQPGTVGLDHGQRGGDGHRGIEGVAAAGENVAADFAGQWMRRGHGTAFGNCGLRRAGQQEEGKAGTGQVAQGAAADPCRADHQALPVMIRYFCISSSLLSTLFSSSGMQSTGHTC